MKRLLLLLLVVSAGAFAVAGQGQARVTADYCCLQSGVSATVDPATKALKVTWKIPGPPTGIVANMCLFQVLAGSTLDAKGVVTDGGLMATSAEFEKGGVYDYALTCSSTTVTIPYDKWSFRDSKDSQGVYVQLKLKCDQENRPAGAGTLPIECYSSHFLSEAVKFTPPSAKPATTAAPTVTAAALPADNGKPACRAARARITYLNGEIAKLARNIAFPNRLNGNEKVQKVRQQQLQARLKVLQAQLAVAVKQGTKACAR